MRGGKWEAGRTRKSGGFLKRQSSAGKYGRSLCQQPLRAEQGVGVKGGFLPWHFDKQQEANILKRIPPRAHENGKLRD